MPKTGAEFKDLMDKRLREGSLPKGVTKLAIESRIGRDPLVRTADQYIHNYRLRIAEEDERLRNKRSRSHIHLGCGK